MTNGPHKAIGIYWTLPVPWAGFTVLPADVDAAAAVSRTIRYQRDLVRRRAAEDGLELAGEAVFLEIAPDRGSREIAAAVRRRLAPWIGSGALVLWVDFAQAAGWRAHDPLRKVLTALGAQSFPIWPDPLPIDGKPFDVRAHFEDWRARQQAWTEAKPAREAAALARLGNLQAQGASLAKAAARLNAEGLPSLTGRPWTADNLRKFLARQAALSTDAENPDG